MITFHLLLARKHGAQTAEPLLVSFADSLALTLAYERITGAECAEFAKTYGELLFIKDGSEYAHNEFPDPATVEAARVKQTLADARAVVATAERANEDAKTARNRAQLATAALKDLTPEQKKLLADEDEKIAQALAVQKAADDARSRQLEEEARLRDEEIRRQAAEDLAAAQQSTADLSAAAEGARKLDAAALNPPPAAPDTQP